MRLHDVCALSVARRACHPAYNSEQGLRLNEAQKEQELLSPSCALHTSIRVKALSSADLLPVDSLVGVHALRNTNFDRTS
jgi:hypothetical protein